MKEDDFVLPSEFKIDFKLKTTTTKTSTTADQINFSMMLVNSDGNNIGFPKSETKIPIVNFIIQIIN